MYRLLIADDEESIREGVADFVRQNCPEWDVAALARDGREALALALSGLERLLPAPSALPGIKLGLGNLAVVIALYRYGARDALLVSVARILLSSFLFSTLSGALYSLAGGLCALGAMALLYRCRAFSPIGVSALGGFVHNAAQLAVAVFVVRTRQVAAYFPILAFFGLATGILNGVIANLSLARMRRN